MRLGLLVWALVGSVLITGCVGGPSPTDGVPGDNESLRGDTGSEANTSLDGSSADSSNGSSTPTDDDGASSSETETAAANGSATADEESVRARINEALDLMRGFQKMKEPSRYQHVEYNASRREYLLYNGSLESRPSAVWPNYTRMDPPKMRVSIEYADAVKEEDRAIVDLDAGYTAHLWRHTTNGSGLASTVHDVRVYRGFVSEFHVRELLRDVRNTEPGETRYTADSDPTAEEACPVPPPLPPPGTEASRPPPEFAVTLDYTDRDGSTLTYEGECGWHSPLHLRVNASSGRWNVTDNDTVTHIVDTQGRLLRDGFEDADLVTEIQRRRFSRGQFSSSLFLQCQGLVAETRRLVQRLDATDIAIPGCREIFHPTKDVEIPSLSQSG